MWIYLGELSGRNFQRNWNSIGDFYVEGIIHEREILYGGITTRKNYPWGNFLRDKFSSWGGGFMDILFPLERFPAWH